MERAGTEQWSRKDVARLLALVESDRDYFKEIVASLPVALAVLSPNRAIVSANRAFRDLFRLSPEDLGNRVIDQILPGAPPLLESLQNRDARTATAAFSISHENRTLRMSWVRLRGADDPEERETLLIAEDLTGVPASQIAPSQEASGPKPSPQPRQLTHVRQDALRGLSARLAHDLNNPLMVITGYTEEMLEGVPADDPNRLGAEQILAAAQRISHLTGQLLAFARTQAKPPQPVDVTALIRGMERDLAAQNRASQRSPAEAKAAPGKLVRIELPPSATPLWASVDSSQLREILFTLASSAREDARERTRLKIACESVATGATQPEVDLAPGRYVKITVEDNGRGYTPEKSAVVFESFLSKETEPSVGADLARAYAIVREWGGALTFASEPARGSVFTVYLPAAESGRGTAPSPKRTNTPASNTVLVVDDEPEIRALVAKILRREKYNVIEAGNARQALAAVPMHEGSIQLLVTDVMLGDLTGPELARQLHENLPDLKVLYISGFSGSEPVPGGAQPGAQFLQKPFTLAALLSKVRDLLAE